MQRLKGFVEATSQGLDVKDSCVAATTANITISTALNNGDTIRWCKSFD